jgi:type I restriction enzyme S subunit
MGEWKEYKYTDLCTLIGGGTPKTSEPMYWGGKIPWLSVKDFGNDEKYVYKTEKTITEAGLNNSSTKLLNKDDIIISARGTIGAIAMLASEMAFNQSCFGIRSNNLSDQHFLYYLTKTKIGELRKSSHGSVFDTITRDTFEKIDCLIPPLQTQQKIASILSALDDKIEVNRKINENLEQQAQALFKSWFVDFEPFKNGEFVESELGMIPKGWRVGKLSEIADVNPYRNLKKGINALYLDMKNMPTKGSFPMNWDYKLYSGGMKFKNEDTLMARITPCLENGKVAYVNFLEDDEIAFGSTEYIVMTPKDGFMPELLYFLCRDDFFKGYATKNMNGSSGRQRVSAETIGKYPIAIPPKVQIESIASYYKGIMDNVKKNGLESRRLASLRDTLLPKLMSGELKVNEL